MNKYVLGLVVSFFCAGNVFAGDCTLTHGNYYPSAKANQVGLYDAQILKAMDQEPVGPTYTANSAADCYKSAINYARAKDNFGTLRGPFPNFFRWVYRSTYFESPRNKEGDFILGAPKIEQSVETSGLIDFKSDINNYQAGDQRFWEPRKNFWICVAYYTNQNGNPIEMEKQTSTTYSQNSTNDTYYVKKLHSTLVRDENGNSEKGLESCGQYSKRLIVDRYNSAPAQTKTAIEESSVAYYIDDSDWDNSDGTVAFSEAYAETMDQVARGDR